MSLTDFITEAGDLYEERGITGLRAAIENFNRGLAVRFYMLSEGFDEFETVLDEDWDLFIVLDACRYDLMKEVEDEYDFIEVTRRQSYAASSQDWLQNTFFRDECSLYDRVSTSFKLFREPYQNDLIADTFPSRDVSDVAYLTTNPQSYMLDAENFAHLEEVWREEWGQAERTRALTEFTIQYLRQNSPGRTIVHYMKPHEPFKPGDEDRPGTAWSRLQWGEDSFDDIWDGYVENLRDVLDEVELLLQNVDADKVVISADHGNSLGEFGFYGHRPYLPLKGMRDIPWVETTATDTGNYSPDSLTSNDSNAPEELLEDLGYL